MEPAKIDWKTIDSVFVEDDLYEHINAPKWVDFSSPEDTVNDEVWFCRPDCKHPKTIEDFYKSPSKLLSLVNISEMLQFSPNRRGEKLKRRGHVQSSISSNNDSKFHEDSENNNPNLSTPFIYHTKPMKEAIKSSTEKKKMVDDSHNSAQNDETPRRLKSTLSARNLFAGKEILSHITEFCNELKKLATRTKERESGEGENMTKSPEVEKKHTVMAEGNLENMDEKEKETKPLLEVSNEKPGAIKKSNLENTNVKEKERKPLLEVSKEKSGAIDKSSGKGKLRRKERADEAENIPISVDLKNIKSKDTENLLRIRTSPPTPQCFSAVRGPARITAAKASKTKGMEREILQEMDQSNKEELLHRSKSNRSVSNVADKEAKTLDVFWFLKPCTLPN